MKADRTAVAIIATRYLDLAWRPNHGPSQEKESWHHGKPRFHRVAAPSRQRLEQMLDRLIRRLLRRLTCDGWLILDPEQPWLDLEPADVIDSLAAASIRYRIALGQRQTDRTIWV